MKPQPQRKHYDERPSASSEDAEIGKRTFITHNRKTVNEVEFNSTLGSKKRIDTVYQQRNGIGMRSQGDKIYRAPEYQSNFFRAGGLIVGSTNKAHMKSSGNAKAIDFLCWASVGQGPSQSGA